MNFNRIAFAVGASVAMAVPVRANLSFNLIPDPGTPQFAIDGFYAAANLWSSVLGDDITINIAIGYEPLGANVLGSTSASFIERSYSDVYQALEIRRISADDFSAFAALQIGTSYNRLINHTSDNPNGPNSGVPYVDTMDRVGLTTANARVLGLLEQDDSLDATIRFSSDFNYDFSNGDPIAPGHYDFVGIAAHEIGHVLGFISGVDDIDELDGLLAGGDFSSNLIDLYRYSDASVAAGNGYTDYTADEREKYFSVNGGPTPVNPLATGVFFGDGAQASHWKDNLGIGIMDPTAATGEQLNISINDLRVFDVLGFSIVPEPATTALMGVGLLFLLVRDPRRQPQ